jgi:SAM-dependent methyltransferase
LEWSGTEDLLEDLEQADYAESELRYNRFMEPAVRSALGVLSLPAGSRGLDAGCGPGGLIPLLLEATGGEGLLTGVDVSRPHLACAERRVAERGVSDRVTVFAADLRAPLPFRDGEFDWVWCADVLWPRLFAAPEEIVKELSRVVRPGGFVAVFFVNGARGVLLPGLPHIERRLQAADARKWAGGRNSATHPENAVAWLRAAGLQDVRVTPHLVHAQHPLDADRAGHIAGYLLPEYRKLTREELRAEGMCDADWELWRRVSDPDGPEYLLREPDYYYVMLATLTAGRVASRQPQSG